MLPRTQVRELDMTVDEALKYIISMGVVAPAASARRHDGGGASGYSAPSSAALRRIRNSKLTGSGAAACRRPATRPALVVRIDRNLPETS